jgi:hypothetical protein
MHIRSTQTLGRRRKNLLRKGLPEFCDALGGIPKVGNNLGTNIDEYRVKP